MYAHPLCRIPPLDAAAPDVPTEKGPLAPHRALVYDYDLLLLHGPAATRPGHCFSASELAGFAKTASRLAVILERWIPRDLSHWGRSGWGVPHWGGACAGEMLIPLEWLSPEAVLFTTGHDRLLYDLVLLTGRLEQLESLTLTLGPDALLFRRC